MPWIEKLDDLTSLDLAPTLVEAVVEDVTGEPCEIGDWTWGVYYATRALRRYGERNELGESGTSDLVDLVNLSFARLSGRPSPEHEELPVTTKTPARRTTAAKPKTLRCEDFHEVTSTAVAEVEELTCRVCGCTDVSGCRGGCSWVIDAHANTETDLCSACVERRGALPGAKLCMGCRTVIAGDVAECPVCHRTTFGVYGPVAHPSSLGVFNGEVLRGDPPVAAAEPQWKIEELPVERIDPSPYQPRQEFDADELQTLADDVARAGVMQPVLVRPKGDRYELVFGERRLRASRLAGKPTIPGQVRAMSDQEAAERTAQENARQANLNPIEEARQIEILRDVGLTQEQIAGRLGVTQPTISHRLRLLELPDAWRRRIMSRDIPPTHAKELVKWQHRPNVLALAGKKLGQVDREKGSPSVREFADVVRRAVMECSRGFGHWECHFKLDTLDDKLKEKLDVERFTDEWGAKHERAFNVRLFDKLNREADKKRREAEEKRIQRATTSNGRSGTRKPAASRDPKEGPAAWKVGQQVKPWLAGEILGRLKPTHRDVTLRMFVGFWTGVAGDDGPMADGTVIAKILGLKQRVTYISDASERAPAVQALAQKNGSALDRIVFDLAVAELKRCQPATKQKGTVRSMADYDAEYLAAVLTQLGGDPLAYALTREDLELYPDTSLRTFPGSENVPAKATRKFLVDRVLKQSAEERWLPEEFATVLQPAVAKKPAKSPTRKAR